MQEEIRLAIEKALGALDMSGVDFSVEYSADLSHGDYASNVAMVAAKHEEKNPRECAERILGELEKNLPQGVEKIEIAGPGFINFHLSRKFFSNQVAEALKKGGDWGKNVQFSGQEILIEYTSPNFFKPLHIGNLVGNIVGESLARLFEFAGATVRRINYPSDIGLTVAKGVWGLVKTNGNPSDIVALGEAYRAGNEAYEHDEAAKKEIEEINRALYAGTDEALNALRNQGIQTSQHRLKALCDMLGTEFDFEIFESQAGPVGSEIVQAHQADGIFEESNGAVIFAGEKYGLHTRVFLNSQGLPTYEAKDLGNFFLKQKQYPDWSHSIVVTGNEQREYFKVIIQAIRMVFPEANEKVLEHTSTGFLTLTTGKMSSRKGNVLSGESLLLEVRREAAKRIIENQVVAQTRVGDGTSLGSLAESIAVAALKYQILRQGVGMDIVFEKNQALAFEGASGPYLQYTHARICSILGKAHKESVTASCDVIPQQVYDIERLLYQFPEVTEHAVREREPHHVATYLTTLAGAFNRWYAKEQIVNKDDKYSPYKVALAEAVAQTLKNGLWCLGIKAPERM